MRQPCSNHDRKKFKIINSLKQAITFPTKSNICRKGRDSLKQLIYKLIPTEGQCYKTVYYRNFECF